MRIKSDDIILCCLTHRIGCLHKERQDLRPLDSSPTVVPVAEVLPGWIPNLHRGF